MPVMLWSSMAWTNCRMGAGLIPAPRPARMARVAALSFRLPPKVRHKTEVHRRARPEDPRDESVTAVHSAAGRHHPPDRLRPPGGLGRLPPIAHLFLAAGRLPHDSGANVLSRRQSGGHGFLSHRAPRRPVRPDPRPESDDVHKFLW